MKHYLDDEFVLRTPNPLCPACQQKRQHREPEWKEFHPLAGTGRLADTTPIKKGTK